MTAKEWRDKNPSLSGNIREYTDILHLVVLVNLENLNADMISEGISQSKRLEKLNSTARKQLELLKNNNNIKNNIVYNKKYKKQTPKIFKSWYLYHS